MTNIHYSCDVCEKQTAKYRCPGCGVQTCCLSCVKQHKTESGCDGVRNKTGYVGMKQFSDMNLLSGELVYILEKIYIAILLNPFVSVALKFCSLIISHIFLPSNFVIEMQNEK